MFQCRLNFCIDLFSAGLLLAMPCKTASKKKTTTQHNIKKTHIHIFRNRLPGVAAIILELLFQNSEGAVVVMCAKVTLTKNFSIKTLYIKNGNALPILTLEL